VENASITIKYKHMKTPNDWLNEMIKMEGSSVVAEEVPEGWMTMAQMAHHAGVATTTMNARITKWTRAGLVQRKKFKICVGRQTTDIWHYNKMK